MNKQINTIYSLWFGLVFCLYFCYKSDHTCTHTPTHILSLTFFHSLPAVYSYNTQTPLKPTHTDQPSVDTLLNTQSTKPTVNSLSHTHIPVETEVAIICSMVLEQDRGLVSLW